MIWNYLWPVLLIVGANTVYHLCSKEIPAQCNPFASLTVTYLVAAAWAFFIFLTSGQARHISEAFSKLNWTAPVLGMAIVFLEFGFLSLYRAGWKISIGNLVAALGLACVLLLIGVLFYKEALTLRQLIGIGVCLLGLVLLAR